MKYNCERYPMLHEFMIFESELYGDKAKLIESIEEIKQFCGSCTSENCSIFKLGKQLLDQGVVQSIQTSREPWTFRPGVNGSSEQTVFL